MCRFAALPGQQLSNLSGSVSCFTANTSSAEKCRKCFEHNSTTRRMQWYSDQRKQRIILWYLLLGRQHSTGIHGCIADWSAKRTATGNCSKSTTCRCTRRFGCWCDDGKFSDSILNCQCQHPIIPGRRNTKSQLREWSKRFGTNIKDKESARGTTFDCEF